MFQYLQAIGLVGGALIAVGHVVQFFSPPNTIAFKVAQVIMNGVGSLLAGQQGSAPVPQLYTLGPDGKPIPYVQLQK